jgi:hypothetical protein
MALICLNAPDVEPIDLAHMKLYLKVEHAADDRLLEGMIKAARQAIEAYTTRSLLRHEWRLTLNVGFATAQSGHNYLTHPSNRSDKGIELPRSPFMELLGEPKILDKYGTRSISHYRLDQAGRSAKIHFASDLAQTLDGQGTLQIDFAAGYGKRPDDVPAPLKEAMMIIVALLYDNRTGANDNISYSVPMNATVVNLIKPYQVLRLL